MSDRVQKRFTDLMRDIRGGDVIDDLTEQFRTLVQRVNETGQAGSLTLTLKVKRASKGSGNTLVIADDIKLKLPTGEKGETILFATPDGDLQRNDPRQPSLLPKPAATVHEIPRAAEGANNG